MREKHYSGWKNKPNIGVSWTGPLIWIVFHSLNSVYLVFLTLVYSLLSSLCLFLCWGNICKFHMVLNFCLQYITWHGKVSQQKILWHLPNKMTPSSICLWNSCNMLNILACSYSSFVYCTYLYHIRLQAIGSFCYRVQPLVSLVLGST